MPATTYVRVPKDLGPVTTIAHGTEVPAQSVGLHHRAVDTLWHRVEALYRTHAYPAITFCLRVRGEIVLNRALGHTRGNGPRDGRNAVKVLAKPETPICVFSASKAITAILIHKLAEEGGVDLDQRVAHYLPEFAQNGKSATTLSQVLSHRGGFPMFDLPKSEIRPELLLDWQRCVDLICKAPPAHNGRTRMAYHAITGGHILGEVLQRVTGQSIQHYLDEKIRRPMGMTYFRYGLPPEQRDEAALNYVAGMPVRFPISLLVEKALMVPMEQVVETSNHDIFFDAVIPAGNLYCTAEELSRFYQMLLNGGEYAGKTILKPATVERAVRPACRLQFDHTLKMPMRYSEGLMLGQNPVGLYGPMSGRAYGHLGFMNILGWADPARDVAAGLLVSGKAVLGTHLLALGQLLGSVTWQCRH